MRVELEVPRVRGAAITAATYIAATEAAKKTVRSPPPRVLCRLCGAMPLVKVHRRRRRRRRDGAPGVKRGRGIVRTSAAMAGRATTSGIATLLAVPVRAPQMMRRRWAISSPRRATTMMKVRAVATLMGREAALRVDGAPANGGVSVMVQHQVQLRLPAAREVPAGLALVGAPALVRVAAVVALQRWRCWMMTLLWPRWTPSWLLITDGTIGFERSCCGMGVARRLLYLWRSAAITSRRTNGAL